MDNQSAESKPHLVNSAVGDVRLEFASHHSLTLGSDGPLNGGSPTALFQDAEPKDMPDYLAAGYSVTLDLAKRQFSEACAPTFMGTKQTATSLHIYSAAGQLLSFDDITGTTTTFTYDTNHRVVSSASSACQTTSTYNDQGQLTQETIKDVCSGALMTVSYAYDPSGNETTRTFSGDGFPTLSLERTLLSDGRLKQFVLRVDDKEHRSDHYTYDSDERLHKWYCTGENAPVSSSNKAYTEQVFTYDTHGNVVSRSHKSSKGAGVSTYGYDPDRPGALISSNGDPQVNDQRGRTLKRSNRKLGYHANGQIKSYSSQAGGEGADYQFAYDTQGRIREVVLGEQREVYHYREGSIYAVQQLGDHFTGKAAKRRMVLLNNSPSCFLQQITEATGDVWESTTCTFELRDAAGTVFASLKHGQSTPPVYYSYLPYGFRVRDLASTTWLGFKGELLNPLSLYHLGNGDRLYDAQLHRYQVPAGAGLLATQNGSPYVYCNGDPVNKPKQAPTS